MSDAFTKLAQGKLNAAVAGLLCPRIEAILSDRGPGHCMRVTDLDDDVMESVCQELRRTRPDGNIFILGGARPGWYGFSGDIHQAGGAAKSRCEW